MMKKLKASTIVETIVAMTLIMISFGVVVALFISNSGNQNRLKLNAYLLCEDIKTEAKVLKNFVNEEIEFENLMILKTIDEYKDSRNIKILIIEAYTNDEKLIYRTKELIDVKNN